RAPARGVDRRVAGRPTPPPSPAVPKPDLSKFTPHPDKAYLEIGYSDAKALHDAGALVLDARRTSVYAQGHIAGARPFSVWESDIDEKVNKLFEERGDPRDQAKPIVVYCSGGECEDSHMLSQKLWGIQFNNVYVYKDGFPDWQAKHGPVRTGSTP
ncbi:MAG: rhodanese-like domain-containing protein, partial [Thermoanaerobaculia bacterium]